MYPRDIAAIIGKQIYLTSSSSMARKTENFLSESFFNNHPDYKECEIIDFTFTACKSNDGFHPFFNY